MRKFSALTMVVTLITASLLSCSVAEPPADLEWRNGWVRALPPGAGMTAAYGELRNNSQTAIEVTAWESNVFAQVSLHQSSIEDGVSRMREQKAVQIAAGESLSLEPGGLHLMLMKPTAEVAVGDGIEIGISSGSRRYVFNLPVESR
ncbi:MAG TPA: copper chaperone PCu(A)C [Xanthomonadales bacterium]|nr:copper chaperone PCu(A)C [Xanthomonadales bacterium]